MISIADEEIILERRTSRNRFLLFTSTDVPPTNPLPFWGVTLDTNGDAVGILVRLDRTSAANGWTLHSIIQVIQAMALAEQQRRPGPIIEEVCRHVTAAAVAAATRFAGDPNQRIEFDDTDGGLYALGAEPDTGDLWLCANPEDEYAEGISAEALLIISEELLKGAARSLPPNALIGECKRNIRAALAAEVRRVASLCATLTDTPETESDGR